MKTKEEYGKYTIVSLYGSENGERLKTFIPEIKHQTQILHGLAVGELVSAF
jgi:hypothetical protein